MAKKFRELYNPELDTRPKSVSFHAGPGVGKSTTAAALFAELKYQGFNVELVTEFVKELAWRGIPATSQRTIFETQKARLEVANKVSFAITDCPLIMQLAYLDLTSLEDIELKKEIIEEHKKYNNLNIVLHRSVLKPYNPSGRYQTEEEAIKKDDEIISLLNKMDIPYYQYTFGRGAMYEIVDLLKTLKWI